MSEWLPNAFNCSTNVFCRQHHLSPTTELANVEAMKKFLDNEEYSIVGKLICLALFLYLYLRNLCEGFFAKDSKLKEAFMTTASALRNAFRFAHVVPSIVRDQYNYNE